MGVFDDYIAGLDGQENPDLTEVVSNLLKLHEQELVENTTISSAKIAKMQEDINSREKIIAERDDALLKQQAKNWELVNQIPGNQENPEPQTQENGLPDGAVITIDDLFEK